MENSQIEENTDNNGTPRINRWSVFAVVSTALFMMTADSTIVATALHTIQEDLNTSVSWVGWTLTAYSFGFVLMLPLSAKLSVFYGHRRIFLISIAVFTLASLFCGFSTNIYTLIFFRILQAMGGAGITPSATGIIVEHFGHSRDRFLGLFGSIFATGAMIGPIFGGLFVTYFSWHWIFFFNIPFGIAVILLAFRLIPSDNHKALRKEKMDFPGLILMGIAIMSAMYAATYLGEKNSSIYSLTFIGLTAVSLVSFGLLFWHLKTVKEPFIDPRFIIGKGFSAVNLVNIVNSGMVVGGISLVPLYAIHRYGISELNSGTLLVAQGVASIILSTVMSFYIRKTGYRLPIFIGALLVMTGLILLALEPQFGITPYFWLMSSTFLIGFGFGFMSPASRNAGLQLAPDQSANIAAVRSLAMQMGQITMIAIATAIITAANDPNSAHAWVYAGMAIMLFLALPVIYKVPENKGSW